MRFKVGDLAKIVVSIYPERVGTITSIVAINPPKLVEIGTVEIKKLDYQIDSDQDGTRRYCYDWQLQPFEPPAEPVSLTRTKEE